MASIFLLAIIIALYAGGEVSCQSCSKSQHGQILQGNTCKFQCCLESTVRSMALPRLTANQRCPAFSATGRGCVESSLYFPHKTVIKYNAHGCFICNNGRKVYYKDTVPKRGPESVTGYTLVRFG